MSEVPAGSTRLNVMALSVEARLFGPVKRFIEDVGGLIELAVAAVVGAFRPPLRLTLHIEQHHNIGVG